MELKIFNEEQVKELLQDKKSVLAAVEDIFVQHLDGEATMVPKVYLDVGIGDDYRAMPSFNKKYACIKWIADYTSNQTKGLPTTQALIILNDKSTGTPLALIEANHLTKLRTAAATALATRNIVQDEHIKKISFIGCGAQTLHHIDFLTCVLGEVDEISLYDALPARAHALAAVRPKVQVADSLEECVKGSRVVTTLTPAREPYLFRSMLPEACHINAVGADAVGKRELGDDIFPSASTIVCDDYEQAKHSGEMQYYKFMANAPKPDSTMCLGSLLRTGKQNTEGLSVYDSTGLAIEDLALAEYVFNAASPLFKRAYRMPLNS